MSILGKKFYIIGDKPHYTSIYLLPTIMVGSNWAYILFIRFRLGVRWA